MKRNPISQSQSLLFGGNYPNITLFNLSASSISPKTCSRIMREQTSVVVNPWLVHDSVHYFMQFFWSRLAFLVSAEPLTHLSEYSAAGWPHASIVQLNSLRTLKVGSLPVRMTQVQRLEERDSKSCCNVMLQGSLVKGKKNGFSFYNPPQHLNWIYLWFP
jgi:hypothetical protein